VTSSICCTIWVQTTSGSDSQRIALGLRSPVSAMDIMTMRATQKNRMSRPVSSSAPGKKRPRSPDSAGQPNTEKGNRPLENQVSSTSSSCTAE
jgi:hypothetical protein